MLAQAVNELARQGSGDLEKLIRVEERSHCGVQTDRNGREGTQYCIVNSFITTRLEKLPHVAC